MPTQYGQTIAILVINEKDEKLNVLKAEFVAESDLGYSNERVYQNLLIDDNIKKSYLRSEMIEINLGVNLKKSAEVR